MAIASAPACSHGTKFKFGIPRAVHWEARTGYSRRMRGLRYVHTIASRDGERVDASDASGSRGCALEGRRTVAIVVEGDTRRQRSRLSDARGGSPCCRDRKERDSTEYEGRGAPTGNGGGRLGDGRLNERCRREPNGGQERNPAHRQCDKARQAARRVRSGMLGNAPVKPSPNLPSRTRPRRTHNSPPLVPTVACVPTTPPDYPTPRPTPLPSNLSAPAGTSNRCG